MHGVLLWNSETDTAPLATWQDQRSTAEELIRFRHRTTDISLQHGFGAVTLMWLAEHQPEILKQYRHASTIHDFIAACLCKSAPITDPSDAASWGIFELRKLSWDDAALARSEVPASLFPRVLPMGTVLGPLKHQRAISCGLPVGIPVLNAVGDNQASLFATIEHSSNDVALSVATGGQLSVVLSSLPRGNLPSGIDIRPYIDGKYIAVAASLCGGKSFAWIRETIRNWCADLGVTPPEDAVLYKRLNDLGLEHLDSPLAATTSFIGERHAPDRRGSISNIDLSNFTLGNLSAAIVRDIINNLYSMMPREFLSNKKRVVGSGNGLRQLPLAQRWAEKIIGLPLHLISLEEEAAVGAARLAQRAL